MGEVSVFDKLVAELSKDERSEFLEKIKFSFTNSEEPLAYREETEEVDLSEEYRQFGFFRKIVIFFIQLFTGKDFIEITEELLIRDLGVYIEKTYPGLFHARSGQLLETMYTEIEGLKGSVSLFKNPIDMAFYINKKDFFAFLGSLEMELIHEKLLMETDPYKREHEFADKEDQEVRAELDESMDRILTEISDSDRERMYLHSQSLSYISELCSFPYDNLLNGFVTDQETRQTVCSVHEIEHELRSLMDLLFSFTFPPSGRLLHALFLFQYQDNLNKKEFELETVVEKQLKRAESALSAIRQFNRDVPLVEIIKFADNNINYQPNRISGGEDWFTLYKKFWKQRMESLFKKFSMERKRINIKESALELVGLEELPRLEYYNSETTGNFMRLKYENSLSFLMAFVQEQLSKRLNSILKLILIDGEFYKEQNRQEFTDAYNGLMRVPEKINKIEYALTPSGETGRALQAAKHEILPPPLKRKKMENLLQDVEEQANDIINHASEHLDLLKNVLNGIRYGEGGGRFDTLSNLGYLGGRNNKATMDKVTHAIVQLKEGLDLLSELSRIESSL